MLIADGSVTPAAPASAYLHITAILVHLLLRQRAILIKLLPVSPGVPVVTHTASFGLRECNVTRCLLPKSTMQTSSTKMAANRN
jgi:hypothetical protein